MKRKSISSHMHQIQKKVQKGVHTQNVSRRFQDSEEDKQKKERIFNIKTHSKIIF